MVRSTASGSARGARRPSTLTSSTLSIRGKSVRDAEVVLEGRQRALVDVHLFGPQMRAGARVDELRVDADSASHPAYAPLEHIPDTQLAADLPGIDGLALECERGVPGDDEASGNSRQITCQVFSYAIGEVVLARIATQVAERAARRLRDAAPLFCRLPT